MEISSNLFIVSIFQNADTSTLLSTSDADPPAVGRFYQIIADLYFVRIRKISVPISNLKCYFNSITIAERGES